MRATRTKRKASGGWRATQGEIPVTGTNSNYPAWSWAQCLFFKLGRTLDASPSRLEIERRVQK
jgi:hypothetical protein